MSSLIDYKLLETPTRGLIPLAKRNKELKHFITNDCTIPHRSLNITKANPSFTLNCEFSTTNYDYEVVTYVDEVQILDLDENIIISISKENIENE